MGVRDLVKIVQKVILLGLLLIPIPALADVPAQFMAKLYTEALGRAPDSGGWAAKIDYFNRYGCTSTTVKDQVKAALTSPEFNNLGYNNAAKVLLLYRTALDREPDANGFNLYLGQLNAGVPYSTVIQSVLNSSEFNSLMYYICSGGPYFFNALGQGSYAIAIPGVPSISQADLQTSLNAAGPGGTVALPNMTVVALNSTLTIPAGVTLTTMGNPSPTSHGMMARLVRGPSYSGGEAMVKLTSGARLTNLWIDGQRGALPNARSPAANGPFVQNEINIQSLSGANNQITDNFIANTAGWSSMQVLGVSETGVACQANLISGNLITAYASNNDRNYGNTWSDGISDACEDSVVSNNSIIDATDGAIVLFRAQVNGIGAVQHSQVTDNIILNAGNSAYVGIAVDPLYVTGGCNAQPSFAGSYVGRNAFWTGPRAIVEIGLAVGTAEWFYSHGGCIGTGANVSDNTTNGFRANVNTGIAIQGMWDVTVQRNNLLVDHKAKGNCPALDVPAGVSAGLASGSIQSYVDVGMVDCI